MPVDNGAVNLLHDNNQFSHVSKKAMYCMHVCHWPMIDMDRRSVRAYLENVAHDVDVLDILKTLEIGSPRRSHADCPVQAFERIVLEQK